MIDAFIVRLVDRGFPQAGSETVSPKASTTPPAPVRRARGPPLSRCPPAGYPLTQLCSSPALPLPGRVGKGDVPQRPQDTSACGPDFAISYQRWAAGTSPSSRKPRAAAAATVERSDVIEHDPQQLDTREDTARRPLVVIGRQQLVQQLHALAGILRCTFSRLHQPGITMCSFCHRLAGIIPTDRLPPRRGQLFRTGQAKQGQHLVDAERTLRSGFITRLNPGRGGDRIGPGDATQLYDILARYQ